MNKTDIVEIMSKKTTKLAVLSVVVVGMMVVLVPMIVEADARIDATAISLNGTFSGFSGKMEQGRFLEYPHRNVVPSTIHWLTAPIELFGPEKGTVIADVKSLGTVTFSFSNPARGDNTCAVKHSDNLRATCTITQGNFAVATFVVSSKDQQNTKNLCHLVPKLGGLDQLKIIREKLHC